MGNNSNGDTNSFQALLGQDGQNIKPLKPQNQSADFYQAKPQNTQARREEAEAFMHAEVSMHGYNIAAEDVISYRRDGVQHQLFDALKKGELTVYDSIDLHGMTLLEAEIYMAQTIDNQAYPHMTTIRIVHGKGYNVSGDEEERRFPKLKNFTARYLMVHPRVLAYHSCPIHRGGNGAVFVLLSRADPNEKYQ